MSNRSGHRVFDYMTSPSFVIDIKGGQESNRGRKSPVAMWIPSQRCAAKLR
jgi:hypothetical protein